MKQALKWLGIIAGVLVMLVVVAILILTPLANRRQQASWSLSDEALWQILSLLPREDSDPVETGYTIPAAPASTGSDTTGVDSRDPSQGDDSGDRGSPPIPSRPQLRLARTLTREDLLREFNPSPDDIFDNTLEKMYTVGLKLKLSAARAADSILAEGFALEVGIAAMRRGDIEEARNYMRETLEISVRKESKTWRNAICGRLVWVEQDPEVAAVLLEKSCSIPPSNPMLPTFLVKAQHLAILTGSDELADYYYARWNALEPEGKVIWEL